MSEVNSEYDEDSGKQWGLSSVSEHMSRVKVSHA